MLSLTVADPRKYLAMPSGVYVQVHLCRRVLVAFDLVQSVLGRVDDKLGRIVATIAYQLPAHTLLYVQCSILTRTLDPCL